MQNVTFRKFVSLFAGLSLLLSAACAAELLPAPTGPHATGRMSFHWRDGARDELETAAPGDKRELMVHLFYPADASAQEPRAAYVPDADAMQGVWNAEQIAGISAMRAFSRENAPPLRGTGRFPIALFSPGGGAKALTYHALLEDLASHGWVVAAIEPPYNARALRLPDGRVLGGLAPAERGWPQTRDREQERRNYVERIAHWARDATFVIDRLVALDRETGPLSGRLNLARGVGVLGHSRGGQMAGAVRVLDPRVRAGINLDGAMGDAVIQPVKGPGEVGTAPFLWLNKALPRPPDEERLRRAGKTRADFDTEIARVTDGWDRQLASISGGALRVHFNRRGIEHMDFSDEPFWAGATPPADLPGKIRTIADARAWVRAFLDGTVRGEWAELRRLAASSGPAETSVHIARAPWPAP